jgi:spermidine synthase
MPTIGRKDRWDALSGALAAATLLATGAAGLVYEVAWQRYLAILTGADHVATATTLAVFLGGLSLGYALCGRLSARTERPLLAYAVLEVAIGVWGLLFPTWFRIAERASAGWSFAGWTGIVAGALGVAIPLILAPAMLMGATVPFMTRGLASSLSGLTGTHARVYGLNTLGAVAGTLLAGFALLPYFGLHRTVYLAAAINLAAAGVLYLLSREGWRPGEPASIGHVTRSAGPRLSPTTLALLAAFSGAATLCQENAIIRLTRLTLGGTPYTFAMIVAAFVIAIAVGSLLVSRRSAITSRALWLSATLSTVAWLALFPTYDDWPWAAQAIRFALPQGLDGFHAYHGIVWALLTLALLPAVAPLGALLPLLFHEYRASVPESGRVAGMLLGWNALGALVGSMAGGLLLYYVTDLAHVLLSGPICLAVYALLCAPRGNRTARALSALLLLVAAGMAWTLPGYDRDRLARGTFRIREPILPVFVGPAEFHEARMTLRRVVNYEDGPLATAAVVAEPDWDLPMPPPQSIYIDGKSDSNTLSDRATLRLSAHLPMMLAQRRRQVLLVGQGTGVTAGELALWPEIESIDLVELSPAVARALPLFGDQTGNVQDDARLRLHVQDVVHYLRQPGPRWDVVISEPSNIWNGGNDLLFTVEFFRSLEARLAPDGLLLQWVHLFETDRTILRRTLSSLAHVFPELLAFRGTPGDWLVVASREPIEDVDGKLAAAYEDHAAVRASLAGIPVEDVEALSALRVESFPLLVEWARRSPPHTTGDVALPYRGARAMYRGELLDELQLLREVARGGPAPGSDP